MGSDQPRSSEITGSDDHDEGRILQPNPGCELTARHRSRHPMIGENQVYRSPGRQILPPRRLMRLPQLIRPASAIAKRIRASSSTTSIRGTAGLGAISTRDCGIRSRPSPSPKTSVKANGSGFRMGQEGSRPRQGRCFTLSPPPIPTCALLGGSNTTVTLRLGWFGLGFAF
jgi:hypothetical protein